MLFDHAPLSLHLLWTFGPLLRPRYFLQRPLHTIPHLFSHMTIILLPLVWNIYYHFLVYPLMRYPPPHLQLPHLTLVI